MRFNEVKRLINESKEEDLFEINMSPSNLEKLVAQIPGAQAGMEFEMIVPDTVGEPDYDNFESEPDWDQDATIRRFSDIRDFFYDGDHNSRRDVDNLIDSIMNDYHDSDWLSEKKRDEWEAVAEEHISDLVERDYADDFREQAEQTVADQTPEFGVNDEEYRAAVKEIYEKLFNDKVNEIMADMGREYDEAYEEWDQDIWPEIWNDDNLVVEWLESEGLYNMSAISNEYNINWPYWTEPDGSTDGASIEEVAEEFEDAIGRNVKWSGSYHGAKRTPDSYVVEPDGSLDPDSTSDTGLEFVSPPLTVEEMFKDLDKVKKWADSKGCYTNESTGLHINVSVPDLNLDKIDYVKLALLLGDKYVLEQFERTGNTYCKSAMEEIKNRVKQRPEDAAALLGQMKAGLGRLATKIIHSGATSKYTSINTKDKYVEFRSPGGDWLNDKFFSKIKSTLLRFVVALDASTKPEMYREEYLKKLYQVLQPKGKDDTLTYFAKFAAGEMPKAALKSFIKQAQLERKISKDPTGGQKYWWVVEKEGRNAPNGAIIELVATSKEEALAAAAKEWGLPSYLNMPKADAYPIRPYSDAPVRASVGEPQAIGQRSGAVPSQTDMENRLGWGGQADDANYEIVDRMTNRPVFLFIANTPAEAWRKYSDWLSAAGIPEDTENFGWRPRGARGQMPTSGRAGQGQQAPLPGSTQDIQQRRAQGEFTGQWKVVDNNGRELYRFGGVGNSQADANRVARDWIQQNISSLAGGQQGEQFDVLPIMG